MSLTNTRIEQRYNTDVHVKIKSVNGTSWYSGKLTSLSKSGACIEGRFTWKVGTPIELLAILQTDRVKTHNILASIIWISEDKIGIKFVFAP